MSLIFFHWASDLLLLIQAHGVYRPACLFSVETSVLLDTNTNKNIDNNIVQ